MSSPLSREPERVPNKRGHVSGKGKFEPWQETAFTVTVTHLPKGSYEVNVKCQDGSDYATTRHQHLDVALQMAVPYMAYAAEPDPMAALLSSQTADPNDANLRET